MNKELLNATTDIDKVIELLNNRTNPDSKKFMNAINNNDLTTHTI
jgi:hypothetical protein